MHAACKVLIINDLSLKLFSLIFFNIRSTRGSSLISAILKERTNFSSRSINTGRNIWSRYGNDRKLCSFNLREPTFTYLWMNAARSYSQKVNGAIKTWTTILALPLQKSSDSCTCKRWFDLIWYVYLKFVYSYLHNGGRVSYIGYIYTKYHSMSLTIV